MVASWSDMSAATVIQPHIKLWVTLSSSNINKTKKQAISDTSPLAYHAITVMFVQRGMCFTSPSWSEECRRLLCFDLFHCFPLVLDCILQPIAVFSLNCSIIGSADVFFQKPLVKSWPRYWFSYLFITLGVLMWIHRGRSMMTLQSTLYLTPVLPSGQRYSGNKYRGQPMSQ